MRLMDGNAIAFRRSESANDCNAVLKKEQSDKYRHIAATGISPHWGYFTLKRLSDVLGAVAIALIFLPILLVVPILIRSDGGSALFRQERVGRYGKPFQILKFRTMAMDAEEKLEYVLSQCPEKAAEWAATQKLKNDPRITRVGKFLRKTSIDEIPQLWNVLKGEMSIVGPRPMFPEQKEMFGRYLECVLQARPGCTGLWQVRGRNERTFMQRARSEFIYVRRQSFWMDIKIALKTPHAMFAGRSGH